MGLTFRVAPADVAESADGAAGPAAMVAHNAALKADAVAAREPDALVLGADTTVALDGAILGKPPDLEAARAMLRRLSGREHTVHTAVALRWTGGGFADAFADTACVRFHTLDDGAIDAYFEKVDPLDKAGAYGIQAEREALVASLSGDEATVMGLPARRLAARLREHGFDFRDGTE